MDDLEPFSAAALVAPHPLAAAAGRDVLAEGGTLVEAALAAAMALAVVMPERAGPGGDALWLFREPGPRGRVRALDARGTVAAAARASLRERGREGVPPHGPEAVLVAPGAAAGWIEVLALAAAGGGRMPLARLLAPALGLAREGWDLSGGEAATLARAAPALSAVPGFAAAFLRDGEPPKAGARCRAPALADALDYLAGAGLDDLYRGDVGREIAADLEASSCPLDRADLRATAARWREPAALDLARHAVAVPPTGAGFRAAASLGIAAGLAAAGFDLAAADGFDRWHGLIEASRAADRSVDGAEGPAALLDPARLARRALGLARARASRAGAPTPPLVAEDAASIIAVGRDGAAVSAVFTMGSAFGAGFVSGRTGVLMGNRGALLALDPDAGPALRPGRRAPLRALPAVVSSAREGRVAALGALGEDASAAVAQLAERLMRGMGVAAALGAPRFARGADPDGREGAVLVDGSREPGPLGALRAAGHAVFEAEAPVWAGGIALRDGAGRVTAAADDGAAMGI